MSMTAGEHFEVQGGIDIIEEAKLAKSAQDLLQIHSINLTHYLFCTSSIRKARLLIGQ